MTICLLTCRWRKRLAMQVLSLCLLISGVAAADVDRFSELVLPAIKKHCAKCHGADGEVEGDTNLLELRSDNFPEKVELLHRLVEVIDLGEMPPEDEPQLDLKLREQLVAALKLILRDTVSNQIPGQRTPIRRMNRFQYNNAVTDLFDLKCIVFTLPERMMREHRDYFKPETGKMADVVTVGSRPLGKSQMIERRLAGVAAFPQDLRAEHGFDNRGDHLSLSPLLMEAFLKLGQSITQSADFVPRNVGNWSHFFDPPANGGDENAIVRDRLELFLTRAFRRPPDQELLERYLQFVSRKRASGVRFVDAMKAVAAATIASPRFIYLYGQEGGGENSKPMGDYELASRLSFFLWGSIPDQALLEVAKSETLHQPAVLDAQVQRMLKDRKLKRFCDSFPSQWLQLERIISSAPNVDQYPGFYFLKYRDSMHMMLEPLLLFETVLIENLSITQFIDSDFTYRSGLLEEAYQDLATPAEHGGKKGGGGVGVLNFRRVPVTDRRNGGLITNAAVMTMTSGPERTQPITRGAWMAGVIFNNPPDPPPADVPPLVDKTANGEQTLTLRERLSKHRERADCRGCHEKIDPLGFALENYDPIGVWRETYDNGRDVDAAGTLFRRHEFKNVSELKDGLLAEKDRFTRALAAHLLAFSLAREVNASDQFALDQIVEATANDDYKMQSLLKQVIFSEPFQRNLDFKNRSAER
ncbi:MAG: DUF1592 domain-containing protein [Pirellulaceae bacterium]|nr:DUF1592 domain-containing protein [Pirellulaceae bacterium]